MASRSTGSARDLVEVSEISAHNMRLLSLDQISRALRVDSSVVRFLMDTKPDSPAPVARLKASRGLPPTVLLYDRREIVAFLSTLPRMAKRLPHVRAEAD